MNAKLIVSRLSTSAPVAAWGLAAAIVALSVVPPSLRPQTFVPHRLEHFTIYAVTGLAFALGYRQIPALLAMRLVVFSGCVEIMQLFVPGRHARLSDFVVDAVAACAGVFAAELIKRTTDDPSVSPLPGD